MKKQIEFHIPHDLTVEQGFQYLEQFLVRKISLTDSLYEQNGRVLGRIEAYKDILRGVEILMKRAGVKQEADRSHVKALSGN